ncbi:MAG: hypothetical protein CMP23_15535 [Rickettsiales bacterium]|nr:hypothetical protein [Rickettsiales bacterium]|tara:strand:+ start:2366 stop:2908 length:543 start_codon:yes stop_codon:yes gene_type:complete
MSDDHHEKHYIKIYKVLLVLLAVSIVGPEVAKFTPPTLSKYIILVTAFGIAFVKAYMVAKNFMHLNIEKPIVHYFLATCLSFVVLFFAATSPDVMKQDGSNWVKDYDFPTLQASCCQQNNAADCKLAGLQIEDQDAYKTKIRCVQCLGIEGYPETAKECKAQFKAAKTAALNMTKAPSGY